MKSISGKDLCRILERHGWKLKRVTGSHHIYGKKDAKTILSVPVHGNRDLPIGILRKLLRNAKLTEEDLN